MMPVKGKKLESGDNQKFNALWVIKVSFS